MTTKTLAQLMEGVSQKKLELAKELGMNCCKCGGPIDMFCCGETLPLNPKDELRLQMDYGKLWTHGDADLLSPKMCKTLQELLNLMFEEKIIEIHLHNDGYIQCDR